MGFQFPGSGANYVDVGDVVTARFDANTTWTWLIFFELTTFVGVDRVLAAKGRGAGDHQFELRIGAGTDPVDLEYLSDETLRVSLANAVTGSGWRMASVSCDGAAGGTSITVRLFDMTGSELASGTGQAADPTTQTEPIQIGIADGGSDPMDEVLDFPTYIGRELSQDDCRSFSRNPHGTRRRHADVLEFALKLGAPGVLDLSGNGIGSVVGSLSAGASPPVRRASSPQSEPAPHRLVNAVVPALPAVVPAARVAFSHYFEMSP